MTARAKNDDSGAGCIVVIALAMIAIGSVAIWSWGALLVVGALILAILVLG